MKNILYTLLLMCLFFSGSTHTMKRVNGALMPYNQQIETPDLEPLWLPDEIIDHIAGFCQATEKDLLMKVCKTFHARLQNKEAIVCDNPSTVTLSHKIKKMFEYIHARELIKLEVWLSVLSPNNINKPDDWYTAPFHIACDNSDIKSAQLLIKYGANVNEEDLDEYTPLAKAAESGNIKIAQLLIKHNADVNQPDIYGCTPLYIASENGHIEVVRLLLHNNAAVNQPNNHGWTPLIMASSMGHTEIVQLLLDHGANTDRTIDVALHIAHAENFASIVHLLQDRLHHSEAKK